MLRKEIQPATQFQGMPTAHLIGNFSQGLDKDGLQKIASSDYVVKMASEVKPKKGYSFVHLISTGAGEVYGPNNNADFFNKEATTITLPEPKSGTPARMTIDGGLKKFHNTFTKYANVYREHFNGRKGGKSLGDVVMETYNPVMDRGELIVQLENDKWGDELQKLANGKNVFWSMGAGVPYDICSICGNKARVTADYCNHAKYAKLQLTDKGDQVYLINDQPHFHDISQVAVPADRIAFGLSKVASGNSAHVFDFDNQSRLFVPHDLVEKLAGRIAGERSELLEKLAELEKKITMVADASEQDKLLANSFEEDEFDPCACEELAKYPLEDVINEANKKGIMLPPESFIRIVLKKPDGPIDGLEGLKEALPGIFSKLYEEQDSEVIEDGSYTPKEKRHWSGLQEALEGLEEGHSLSDGPLNSRVIRVTIAKPIEKIAHESSTPNVTEASGILAKEYAKYQLSFLCGQHKYARLAVIRNAKL